MSYLDHVSRTAGWQLLSAAMGDTDQVAWIVPPHSAAFVVVRPLVTGLKMQPSLDPATGEVLQRERRDMSVDRGQLAAFGVASPIFELKVKLDDGEWLVDWSESEWGRTNVKLALARRPQLRQQEMTRADV